ncbi:MAG TPA: hypothetical protein VNE58_00990 [Casimicrobiaceae bacterium]|nr:hypothetical protein [Casimicrobiaceae bacterium]
MPIHYIVNDPEARKGVKTRTIAPSPARSKGRTDFDFGPMPDAKAWPLDSDEFLKWQTREALQRGLRMWEAIAGTLRSWQGPGRRTRLAVHIDAGTDLNAYYAPGEIGFYSHESKNGRLRRFAMSADVVTHEAGHAFLDAIRPDLFDTPFLETNAFHEAFGDCVALLSSLADPDVRAALLKQDPKLSKTNFVETLMESLANATREHRRNDNAAKARRGRNRYQWVLPTELPDDGGPGVLINQDHSFGQVFVGCFYDTLRNVFLMSRKQDSDALAKAAGVVGRLLVRGADKAPITPRFFQAVGRAMSLEDDALFGRKHHEAIRLGFKAHGVLLGAVVAVAPRAALRGSAPKRVKKARGRILEKATLDDLRTRIDVPTKASISVRSYELGGKRVAEACHLRPVALEGLSERLENVVALGPEPTLIGGSRRGAALLGALPDAQTTRDEARTFVAGLVARGAIAYDANEARAAIRKGARGAIRTSGKPTHAVVTERGRKVLRRIKFSCGCGCRAINRNASA